MVTQHLNGQISTDEALARLPQAIAAAQQAGSRSKRPDRAPVRTPPSHPMAMTSPGAIRRLQDWLPRLVLAPSFVLVLVFVNGFIIRTAVLSMSASCILPVCKWVGLDAYHRLLAQPSWYMALKNQAISGAHYIIICIALGLFLAILLDHKIRIEGALRPFYLYPMALSFVVTGTAWK